jgi:uncharacterized membrane protein
MTLFLIGLVLFLGIHSIAIVAPAFRDAQAERNPGAWKGSYAVISIVGFALLIYGYGLARQAPVVVWTPPTTMRHIALLLMLPVFPLLFAAYLPGRIKAAAKHPMLLAVKFWSLAHLLANGTLVDMVLFGAFLAWAVLDRIAVKKRAVPRATPAAAPAGINDAIALVGGLAVYALFLLWAHQRLIGVSPLH